MCSNSKENQRVAVAGNYELGQLGKPAAGLTHNFLFSSFHFPSPLAPLSLSTPKPPLSFPFSPPSASYRFLCTAYTLGRPELRKLPKASSSTRFSGTPFIFRYTIQNYPFQLFLAIQNFLLLTIKNYPSSPFTSKSKCDNLL